MNHLQLYQMDHSLIPSEILLLNGMYYVAKNDKHQINENILISTLKVRKLFNFFSKPHIAFFE